MGLLRTIPELECLRGAPRRLLAVFAHPDDEAYGCAGAFARAGADPEAAAVLLCMTRGEASSMGPRRGLSPGEVGDLRERRLEQVADIVRLDGLIVSSLPDGSVARVPLHESAGVVRAVLDAFRPQVVVTHDARGVNGHADHIAVHWAVRAALERDGGEVGDGVRLAALAYDLDTVEAAKPRLLFGTPEGEIDAVLALSEPEIDAKEACLRVHEGIVTLRDVPPPGEGEPKLSRRPPLERFDFLGDDRDPPVDDLFAGL